MKSTQLKKIRNELKFSFQDMADSLSIPKATYQTYDDGRSNIPEQVAQEIKAILERNRKFDSTRIARIDARIKKEFPFGIMSEVFV